ncbi:4793_t:CDS:2 [Acaulospora colombiana]|uniref:4793_t:CDS:1 n=1 Tax=Acaulospora colombiana TaxID=27376 RepID=A0ACA9JVI5_9GLOM|nr:4793_t:CDS:2 [Acaulospora colombiana]
MPNKLPELYFCPIPPKELFPPSYKDLPKNLIGYFPVSNNVDNIKEAVQILRNESYAIKKLPADYIMIKRSLSPVHWYSENYGIILPINNQDKIKGFIRQLKTEFFFKLPIGPDNTPTWDFMNNVIKNSLDNFIPKRKCMTPTRNIDSLKHYSSTIRATKRAINSSKNNNSEDVFSRLPAIA